MRKTLSLESFQRASQLGSLVANHVRTERAALALAVAFVANFFGQIQHDGNGQTVILPCQRDERATRLGLHVRGIDNGEPPECEPLCHDRMQELERLIRNRLIIFIVANQAPAHIGRENFRRQEMLSRERTLPRPAGADEYDEGELGNGEGHRKKPRTKPMCRNEEGAMNNHAIDSKIPICVGVPCVACSGPMPWKRTV